MTYFLRNEDGETIIEVDMRKDDLSAAVNVLVFAKELLRRHEASGSVTAGRFACAIDDLSEIRGMWFERIQPENIMTIEEFAEDMVRGTAKLTGCYYVQD